MLLLRTICTYRLFKTNYLRVWVHLPQIGLLRMYVKQISWLKKMKSKELQSYSIKFFLASACILYHIKHTLNADKLCKVALFSYEWNSQENHYYYRKRKILQICGGKVHYLNSNLRLKPRKTSPSMLHIQTNFK